MKKIGLRIEPLDLLFFRGGLPMTEGIRAQSGLPNSQTLAGMIRTLLLEKSGADFRAMRGVLSLREACEAAGEGWVAQVRCCGPWPAIERDGVLEPLVPSPANLRRVSGEEQYSVLTPRQTPVPGWTPPESGMLPLWAGRGRSDKHVPGWMTITGLKKYLHGEALDRYDLRRSEDLFLYEERTGVGIDPQSHASREGIIYTTMSIRLKRGVSFYAEVEVPERGVELIGGVGVWGGERRRVVIEQTPLVRWPSRAGERTALLLVSPGFFCGGWRPSAIPKGTLRGAAIRGPYAISGWDLARNGPKPVRFGVDAGSVYFVEGDLVGHDTLAEDEDAWLMGYGFCLKGRWDYAA